VLLAALLSLGLALTGCTKTPEPTPPRPDTTGTGGLTWSDCRSDAEAVADKYGIKIPSSIDFDCATIKVPQDWSDANNGKTFDIALMRAVKGSPDGKLSVVTNPGGPGGSGLDFLPTFVPDLTTLWDKFAIVSFDPRGVGKSSNVKCISDEDLDASFGYDPDPVSQAAYDGNVALSRKIADGCGQKFGEDLRLYNTEQTARDMDAVRAALGDEKLTYLGFSYGTLLGAVYAQLFPTKVRAMVLDGAVDATQTAVQASEGQAMGFERAMTNFTEWCKTNTRQCPIAADPRGAITAAIDSARTTPGQEPRRPRRHLGLGHVGRGVHHVLQGQLEVPGAGHRQPQEGRPRAHLRARRQLRRPGRERPLQRDVRRQQRGQLRRRELPDDGRDPRPASRSGGPSTRSSAPRSRPACSPARCGRRRRTPTRRARPTGPHPSSWSAPPGTRPRRTSPR
jgi:pimeloyl-ACP methyl ester carboxylesterase